MHRERSRSDRLGDEFTVLFLSDREALPARSIGNALELPEELAWADDDRLALIFPHASSQEALDALRSRWKFLLDRPGLRIERLTYPLDSRPVSIDPRTAAELPERPEGGRGKPPVSAGPCDRRSPLGVGNAMPGGLGALLGRS
ncbi:MAG: hypothetical protein KDC38_20135 [Planctomycetes bacterium]|nr:hypothetical protein [Planctomycetota bacterium]